MSSGIIIGSGKLDPNQDPRLEVLRADINQVKQELDTLAASVEEAFRMFAAGNLAALTELRNIMTQFEIKLSALTKLTNTTTNEDTK